LPRRSIIERVIRLREREKGDQEYAELPMPAQVRWGNMGRESRNQQFRCCEKTSRRFSCGVLQVSARSSIGEAGIVPTSQAVIDNEEVVTDTDAGTRVLAALCVASFLAVINFIATSPFYPKMSDDLGTTVSRLGQVITIMVLISAVLGLVVGPLSDRYGYRRPLVFGLLAIAVNLVGAGLTPSFYPLLVLSIIGGLGDALVFGMPMAIAGARFSGRAQAKAISWSWGSMSIAGIVAVPVITLIGGSAGWRAALVISGLAAVVGAWFVAISLPADEQHPQRSTRQVRLMDAYLPLFKRPEIMRIFGVTFLRAACWIGLLTYLGSFLQDALDLSVTQAGLIYTFGGSGFALGSFVAGHQFTWTSPRAIIAIACVVAGLAIGVMLVAAVLWATLPLLFLIAFASAISGVMIPTLLAAESPAGSGTTMVLNGSLLNFGTAAGAGIGGALIAIGGYTALGLGFPLFAFAAAGLACWPASNHERAAKRPSDSQAVMKAD
jgi:predicted MFS family arabinose efflux permease